MADIEPLINMFVVEWNARTNWVSYRHIGNEEVFRYSNKVPIIKVLINFIQLQKDTWISVVLNMSVNACSRLKFMN